jgi:hypothetical protein
MMEIRTPAEMLAFVKRARPSLTPDGINCLLAAIAQREGLIDPSHPPGGTESSGTMHSLVPGVKGIQHFTGQAGDLVGRLRNSPDPDMQAFGRSLNAHHETIARMPVPQLNNVTPAIFYHDGELWISPAALQHAGGEIAMAHELQHSIAQEKITNPKTPQDFEAAAHWEALRRPRELG